MASDGPHRHEEGISRLGAARTGEAEDRSALRPSVRLSWAPRWADDTTVPVLASGKTRTGRLWTYVRDDKPFAGRVAPAAMFYYSPDGLMFAIQRPALGKPTSARDFTSMARARSSLARQFKAQSGRDHICIGIDEVVAGWNSG